MLEYIFIAFVVIFSIQAFFYACFLLFFPTKKSKNISENFQGPISVLICAKNEAENLQNNLSYFEQQDYHNFELILINDNSTDNTLQVMEAFQASTTISVKIVNVLPTERFWGNKKYALTLGIKAASFEQLLFSDADCKPASKSWITELAAHIDGTKNIVLGYGAYEKIKGSFLNKLIRYETLLTALQYFSYAHMGSPYMGVGRNLSYNKKSFFKVNGFMNHMHIKSGDDDLFINEIASKKNTNTCVTPESFTISKPKTTWNSWILQKRRHISTASFYKTKHKVFLGLYHFTQILFFICAPLLLAYSFRIDFVLGMIAFRYLLFFGAIFKSSKQLKEFDLLILAPFYELFLLLSQIFIFIQNLISKPKHW